MDSAKLINAFCIAIIGINIKVNGVIILAQANTTCTAPFVKPKKVYINVPFGPNVHLRSQIPNNVCLIDCIFPWYNIPYFHTACQPAEDCFLSDTPLVHHHFHTTSHLLLASHLLFSPAIMASLTLETRGSTIVQSLNCSLNDANQNATLCVKCSLKTNQPV